jgi:hypothetical protein
MEIPTSFKVGSTDYTVTRPRAIHRGSWGHIWPSMGVIMVATHSKGKPRPEKGPTGQGQTFWHEATHAILHEMGNKLCADELFVNTFAKHLNQIVETAKLKGP